MKEWQKKVLVLMIWGALTTLGVFWLINCFKPYEITKEIELPGNYKIVNKIDGRSLPIKEVHLSGTAVYVPYPDYMSNFYDRENDVIIQSNGTVYYLIKEAGKTFFTKRSYSQWSNAPRSFWIKTMIDDLKIKTSFGYSYLAIVLGGIVIAVFWFILINLAYYAFKKINKANWLKPA